MRRVFALLVMVASGIDGTQELAIDSCAQCDLDVTIQIHDYARVRSEALTRAQTLVSGMYRKIGVRTEWIGVLRPNDRGARGDRREEALYSRIGEVTIIILTPQMAARGRVAPGILGFAAVPEEGMGRIAYVIYDRVQRSAAESAANEVDLLGFVMGHEIAHLLLPRGTQAKTGMMKGSLERRDLRMLDIDTIEFSPFEASQIRTMLATHSP